MFKGEEVFLELVADCPCGLVDGPLHVVADLITIHEQIDAFVEIVRGLVHLRYDIIKRLLEVTHN